MPPVVVDGDLTVAEHFELFAPDEYRRPLVKTYAEEFRVRVA